MSDSNDSKGVLTEEHVIIIACVCGVIIVTLLIILFCFIFRRRRNAAKNYQGGNAGDPPPYNSVQPNKKPQVYDNQGMDTSDLQLTQMPSGTHQPALRPAAPPANSSAVHANSNSFTNNSYGPLDLQTTYSSAYPYHPHSPTGAGNARPKDVNFQRWGAGRGMRSPTRVNGGVMTLDRHLRDNEQNQRMENNNRMDGYPNRDAQGAGGVPRSPTKDKYIDLQDRGGGGDTMIGPDGSYNGNDPSGGGKPKKVIYEVVV